MANETFPALLDKRRPEIEKLLAEWITPERFFSMAMQIARNKDLAKCSAESLVECVLDAARMGLEFGSRGHIYLIPYGEMAQAQVGWRGLAHLKLRAGAVVQVDTDIVFKDDVFECGRSTEGDVFRHMLSLNGMRSQKEALGAYARVKLATGEYEFEVTGRERIQRHRQHSKKPDSLMWTTFWEEGWRKTPYRILDKRLPEGVNSEAIRRYQFASTMEARRAGEAEDIEPIPDDLPLGMRREPTIVDLDAPLSTAQQKDIMERYVQGGSGLEGMDVILKRKFDKGDLKDFKNRDLEAIEKALGI